MPLNECWLSFDVDDQRCHGMLHLPTTPSAAPFPCVVFLHGFTGTHLEPHRLFALMARLLAHHGIAVFRFDFRGNGDSEGSFSEMTVTRELADARAALRLLETRRDLNRDRFGLLGLSMGGLVAALTAGVEALRCVCLLAPAHPDATLERYGFRAPRDVRAAFETGFSAMELTPGVRFEAETGVLDVFGNPVSSAFFEDLMRHDPLEAVRRHAGSSLVVHGSADAVVPVRIGASYAEALGTRLHTVEGGGHTFDSLPQQAEVLRVTLEFFKNSL
ncbi:MAG: alpha/beta hydrolase [Pleurocapsa sp. SU_196_0]|nr:alpha/beta hydrolase [Pleurocapsa sp. SU_196_0]